MEKYLLKEMKKIKTKRNKMKGKKAVSLMISYVLLIVIAITMSIIVFSYLKTVANVKPVIDCKSGTSIFIEDYKCGQGKIKLTLKNNGLFNISGFISYFGTEYGKEPIIKLVSLDKVKLNDKNYYQFENPLKPEGKIIVNFTSQERKSDGTLRELSSNILRNVKIQPFIIDEETNLIVPCGESVIKQSLNICALK